MSLNIKLTPLALLLIFLAVLLWLTRGPDRPARKAKPTPARPPEARAERQPFVIDQNQESVAADYEAETQRLDREAADAARVTYEQTAQPYNETIERMNRRHEQRQQRRERSSGNARR